MKSPDKSASQSGLRAEAILSAADMVFLRAVAEHHVHGRRIGSGAGPDEPPG